MPCQNCTQAEIAAHTARVELEHARDVIRAQVEQIKHLEAALKGKKKRGGDE